MSPALSELLTKLREERALKDRREPRSIWPQEKVPNDQVVDAARRTYTTPSGCLNTGGKGGMVPSVRPDNFVRNPHDVIANAGMGSPQLPSALRGRRP